MEAAHCPTLRRYLCAIVKSLGANFAEFVARAGRSRGRIISEQPLFKSKTDEVAGTTFDCSEFQSWLRGLDTPRPPAPGEVTAADFFDRKP